MSPVFSDGLPRSVICINKKIYVVYGLLKCQVLGVNSLSTTQGIKHIIQKLYECYKKAV